jgi:Trm5-related predicted tRNA methylase
MAKTVSELAREIISRLDQGEALESAISLVLTGQGVDEEVLEELQLAGLRDAVIHEAFHELLDWHANFGGLAEFLEIDEAIHRTAERIGHDFDQDLPDHVADGGSRLVH